MLDVQATWVGMAVPEEVAIEASISDGESLQAGSLKANVLHTPGHTEGSVCLYFPAEKLLIAGDTLFARSIGRTDLPWEARLRKSCARCMIASLRCPMRRS